MKKMFFVFMAMISFTMVYADDYDYKYLAFVTSDNNEQTVSVESLTITFADGKLVATNADGSVSFTLTDLSKMYFTNEATGIESVVEDASLSDVDVYSTSGVYVGKFNSLEDAKTVAKAGIYVVKSGEKTFKVVVR